MDRSIEKPPVDLSITIPVFNEVENVDPLFDDLMRALEGLGKTFEIIFVNDGSTDGSARKLDALATRDTRVKVIHMRRNYGQTAAMMTAILYSSGNIIIPMDGDQQNDPADIARLLEKLDEGFDVVSGWRKGRQDKLSRRLPSVMANVLISRISGVHLHDYGCSLKAYRRDILDDVMLYGEMHRFVPIYAGWQGARIAEIPVNHRARTLGASKYGLSRVWRVLLDLVVIRFFDTALDRPMHFFGQAGLISIFLATVAGLYALYLKFFKGVSFILTPLPLLVTLLFVTGVSCILLGLLAEIQMRTYFESRNRSPYRVKEVRNL